MAACARSPDLVCRAMRFLGLTFRRMKGLDLLLCAFHHPDKRKEWFYEGEFD